MKVAMYLTCIVFLSQMPKKRITGSCTGSCWYANKMIITSFNDARLSDTIVDVYRVVDGENIVFEFNNKIEYGSETNTETFLFEVKDGIESFEIKDKEILKTNCLYYTLGGAGMDFPDSSDFHISKGSLIGKKQPDGIWQVKVDVIVEKRKVSFEHVFKQCQ
ncbi:hypothetical protein AAG747_28115 [Rapidithrix thailandica]|uniref:Uncharacterized protein n=1 Tax=Rapidithrix thailandica TaxID=413964 RepID=A0AAW9SG53_9BACT